MAKTTEKEKKILLTVFSDLDRFLVWHRLNSFPQSTMKDERLSDSIWKSLQIEEIQERIDAAKPTPLDVEDFDSSITVPAELDREELAFLLGLLTPTERRPIMVGVARLTSPLRRRIEAERDRKGIKAVAD